MIEVSGLTKDYGKTKALKNVSFTVGKGQILGLLGPNGAGKTTTIRMLCGAIRPSSGHIKINGSDISKNPKYVKSIIGYLPENPPLYPELKIREQIYYAAKLKGLSTSEIKTSMNDVLSTCGLLGQENKIIANLSKGFKQRTGLAQALVGDPKILILDEPTIGLDPAQIIETRDLIKSMAGNRTVILSSHILNEVQAICTKILILNKGRIVASEDSKSISSKYMNKNVYEVSTDPIDDNVVKIISGLEEVESCYIKTGKIFVESKNFADLRSKISKAVVNGGYGLLELKEVQLSLEDIFIDLTNTGGNK